MSNFALSSGVFFCRKIVSDVAPSIIFNTSVKFGDWFLTPMRYLTDGITLTISSKNESFTLDAKRREFPRDSNPNFGVRTMRVLKVAAAILLLIPGTIIGSAFKGFGYISQPIRKLHSAAVLHYTPVTEIISRGSVDTEKTRLTLTQVNEEMIKANPLARLISRVVVVLKEGTAINQNSDLFRNVFAAKPSSIILIGVNSLDGIDLTPYRSGKSLWLNRAQGEMKIPSFPNYALEAKS